MVSLAILLSLLPYLGRPGRAMRESFTHPPLLDLVLGTLTAVPWIVGLAWAGWVGLLGAILGQMLALYAWIFFHELIHLPSTRGPRIVHFTNRLVGRWANHLALWLTVFGVPVLWLIRLLEIFIYPTLIWLLRFPRYRHDEWVTLSRHKFRDLVGHDLVWCLYCDWMTGTWSLGTEMLRNVESFWCPIRFSYAKKLENCRIDFPDIDGGWVPADGSMAQVQAVLEEKYGGSGDRAWFGHPSRLPQRSDADHHATSLVLPPRNGRDPPRTASRAQPPAAQQPGHARRDPSRPGRVALLQRPHHRLSSPGRRSHSRHQLQRRRLSDLHRLGVDDDQHPQ
ncbi:MAG TPA: hypothetical protein VHP11_07390, partial [Tepidisphaeraceae bacterium]|nr:hypothetical protein [Tepidisphaeraceae bacterium]